MLIAVRRTRARAPATFLSKPADELRLCTVGRLANLGYGAAAELLPSSLSPVVALFIHYCYLLSTRMWLPVSGDEEGYDEDEGYDEPDEEDYEEE